MWRGLCATIPNCASGGTARSRRYLPPPAFAAATSAPGWGSGKSLMIDGSIRTASICSSRVASGRWRTASGACGSASRITSGSRMRSAPSDAGRCFATWSCSCRDGLLMEASKASDFRRSSPGLRALSAANRTASSGSAPAGSDSSPAATPRSSATQAASSAISRRSLATPGAARTNSRASAGEKTRGVGGRAIRKAAIARSPPLGMARSARSRSSSPLFATRSAGGVTSRAERLPASAAIRTPSLRSARGTNPIAAGFCSTAANWMSEKVMPRAPPVSGRSGCPACGSRMCSSANPFCRTAASIAVADGLRTWRMAKPSTRTAASTASGPGFETTARRSGFFETAAATTRSDGFSMCSSMSGFFDTAIICNASLGLRRLARMSGCWCTA